MYSNGLTSLTYTCPYIAIRAIFSYLAKVKDEQWLPSVRTGGWIQGIRNFHSTSRSSQKKGCPKKWRGLYGQIDSVPHWLWGEWALPWRTQARTMYMCLILRALFPPALCVQRLSRSTYGREFWLRPCEAMIFMLANLVDLLASLIRSHSDT